MLLKNKVLGGVVALLLSYPIASHAEAIFGASGNPRCGLGTMIFKDAQSICSQSSEVSTNYIFLNESFSVTTGTSGCSHSGLVQVPQTELIYASANFEELSTELANGRGDTLNGLAEAMGCADQDIPLFSQTGKVYYKEIYSSEQTQPEQMLINLRSRLQMVPRLVHSCRSLQS